MTFFSNSSPRRRGMLLLLTLLMLALFLSIGGMLLTIAIRARAAARANSLSTKDSALSDASIRNALDEALMALLRGGQSVTGTTPLTENILADKYGDPLVTTGSGFGPAAGPFPTVTVALPALAMPASRLNGRILTIKPDARDGDVASFRILAAAPSGTNAVCVLSNVPAIVGRRLPLSSALFPVIINGREFTPVASGTTPEPYDAPGVSDPWLAMPRITGNQITSFLTCSFASGTSAVVDNDNDGVADGVWLTGTSLSGPVIPSMPSPYGGSLSFDVSYLVLDLDGRININAAGMADPDRAAYSSGTSTVLGMGYGPADVDASLLVSGVGSGPAMPNPTGTSAFTGSGTNAAPTVWQTLIRNGTPANAIGPMVDQRRRPPLIGPVVGKYGTLTGTLTTAPVPGGTGDDNRDYQTTGSSAYRVVTAGTNAFADLKARAMVFMTPPGSGTTTPSMTFYIPSSSGTAFSADWLNDPYEVRLDAQAPRSGLARRWATNAAVDDDSPYSLAELEAVLRPFDPDVTQLPQRLATAFQGAGQRMRASVTTDSWDTPALTGLAARRIEDFIANTAQMPALSYTGTAWLSGTAPARNVIAAEVAAGLRFNINRPVTSDTSPQALSQQHEYCKDLYTLVMALSGSSGNISARQAAQWAVDVLDFRDEDSRMTGFEYDTNLANGWNVDGLLTTTNDTDRAVVWGAERPELLITETVNYHHVPPDKRVLIVALHRPARTVRLTGTNSSTANAFEPLDSTLASGTTPPASNALDISKVTSGSSAVWQLRYTPTSAVQFIASPASPQTQFLVTGTAPVTVLGNATAASALMPDDYLCIHSTPDNPFNIKLTQKLSLPVASFSLPGDSTAILERLADPTRPNGSDNPYVPVDRAKLLLVQTPPATPHTQVRNTATQSGGFWSQGFTDSTSNANPPIDKYQIGSRSPSWFHWPNRPFVSQAELGLIGSGTTADRTGTDQQLECYRLPIASLASSTTPITVIGGTTTLGQLILDATYVPTRFAGNAVPVASALVEQIGFAEPGHNILPKWREPGRINVNTIVSGTSTISGTSTDHITWAALTSSTTRPNPFGTGTSGTSATPAMSVGQLLSLSSSANQPVAFDTISHTDPRGLNPFLATALPIRLANTATVRSNVFAIWITVRISDSSFSPPQTTTKRLFAIVDRSIPVGYSPGEDMNVRDCIRIKRYLD